MQQVVVSLYGSLGFVNGVYILMDPRIICAAIALGRSLRGCGTSSDIWVTASGVPIVKEPFKTPVKKATPLPQPVLLAQSDQTKEVEAWLFGIAATTIIVTMPPTMTTNSPNCCRYGRKLLKNTVIAMQIHVINTRTTKICHGWIT